MVSTVTNSREGKHTRNLHTRLEWGGGRVLICVYAGMRARRQTGSGWSRTQQQQSLLGHRYVNTFASPITSALTLLLLVYYIYCYYTIIAIRLRALLFFFLSSASSTIARRPSPNPCVNEWVSECSDGRIADAIRHVSMCHDKTRIASNH